jgi:RluA family pseudouridine synthase
MPLIVNIAAYKFAELTGLAALREELRQLAKAEQLRGTILLSPEGINLFVAGAREGIDRLLHRVKAIPGLADIPVKESFSDRKPFNRMLVKIKREIIAFGVDGIDPRRYTSRRLQAGQLKQWLDAGKPVTLLDTRNNFEVRTGTFENAVAIGVDDFRDFPKAVNQLPEHLRDQPVVTFCTGGIRCEKAAPFLERAGFKDVYQLDGGILKYFETVGGAHYRGDCFVFDDRVALDPELKESNLRQCFACQAVLSGEDQASPNYVPGKSCPHCYQTAEEKYAKLIESRQRGIARVTSPLPGSVPYDNARPLSVPLRFDRMELLEFLDAMHTHLSRDHWIEICNQHRLTCRGEAVQPGRIMRAGERLLHLMPATVEPDVATDIRILHEDDAIVVVHKPAPLPMHPCGRFNRNSLSHLLNLVYHPGCVRPAHRLDADTSGVVVFCKSKAIARILQPQFETGDVNKTYVARVHGTPATEQFECHAPLSDSGIRLPDENGAASSTRFKLIRTCADGTSLLEVTPLSGRTNQIRAHLWSLNLPIVGDPIYRSSQQLSEAIPPDASRLRIARERTPSPGTPGEGGGEGDFEPRVSFDSQNHPHPSPLPEYRENGPETNQARMSTSLSVTDPPMCLHAAEIDFIHPLTKVRVRYASAPPPWAQL